MRPMSQDSDAPRRADQGLIARCRKGDPRAWEALVEDFAALVYSIPRRHGLSANECDDVSQTVFTSLLANLDQLRDDHALPKWLITTAHRATWRAARASARAQERPPGLHPLEQTPSFEEVARLEHIQVVRTGLQQLGQPCRELLELMFVHNADYQTTAARLGLSPGSLGPIRRRCLEKLRAKLSDIDEKP
jgi:RNA polymerase sigma factor (sigma-70 family)